MISYALPFIRRALGLSVTRVDGSVYTLVGLLWSLSPGSRPLRLPTGAGCLLISFFFFWLNGLSVAAMLLILEIKTLHWIMPANWYLESEGWSKARKTLAHHGGELRDLTVLELLSPLHHGLYYKPSASSWFFTPGISRKSQRVNVRLCRPNYLLRQLPSPATAAPEACKQTSIVVL